MANLKTGHLGAFLGDIVGSRFEWHNRKSKEFTMFHRKCMFTDDSVLTLAIMDIFNKHYQDDEAMITKTIQQWARSFPNSGFGSYFKKWIYLDDPKPYGSLGNGSAMRISPVAWYAKTEEELDKYVELFTNITHNSPEALKAAKVVAHMIFMAKNGSSMDELKTYANSQYDLNFDYNDLVLNYQFDATSEGSVPHAIYCFLISNSLEDALRTAISIGGDSDTIGAICCSIAAAYYDDPDNLLGQAEDMLEELKDVAEEFYKTINERNS